MAEKSEHRIALEKRAKELDVEFTWNLGDDKLERRITKAEAKKTVPGSDVPDQGQSKPMTGELAPVLSKSLVVIVTGPKRGRWRIGRHFTHEPVTIPVDELSEDQQTALLSDPKLSVETREAD